MVLPDVDQIVMIDPPQDHVPQLEAGDNGTVRADGNGLTGAVAAREKAPPLHRPSFPAGLFHLEPGASVRKGAGGGADPAAVSICQEYQGLHGQRAFGDGELSLGGVLAAQTHRGCGIGGKGGQFDLFQEEFGDGFQFMDVFPVDGDADGHGNLESLQCPDPLNRLCEIALSPEGVMGDVDRTVDGDLNMVAAAGRCQEIGHVGIDERAVAEDRKTHPVCDNPPDDLPQIGAVKGFASGERNVHDRAALQLGEKAEPGVQRQVLVDIAGPREMAAVCTTEIAGSGDFRIDGTGRPHHV